MNLIKLPSFSSWSFPNGSKPIPFMKCLSAGPTRDPGQVYPGCGPHEFRYPGEDGRAATSRHPHVPQSILFAAPDHPTQVRGRSARGFSQRRHQEVAAPNGTFG